MTEEEFNALFELVDNKIEKATGAEWEKICDNGLVDVFFKIADIMLKEEKEEVVA